MFFILSKLLIYLIKPFFVLSMLLIISFFIGNKIWVKRIRIFVLVGFIFFTNNFIINEIVRSWEVDPIEINQLENNYETGIVLGGIVDPERQPHDRLYFKSGADRVLHAIYLYKAGKIRKILFTGGKAKLFHEPERESSRIKDFFMLCGVNEEDIIIENKSRNTRENAVFTAEIIDKNKKHVLVTSAYHMRRSIGCFEKVGLDVQPFSCDFISSRDQDRFSFHMFLPSVEALMSWDILIKEWMGILVYKISGYI
mgnify:CR=1 FL=1